MHGRPAPPAGRPTAGPSLRSAHDAGLTLLELLAGLAIAAVLTALAVPSFHALLVRNRMAAQVNVLVTQLAVGRSEAVRRDRQVVLCRSTDGVECAVTGGPWSAGWLMFLDRNRDRDRGSNEPILRVHGPLVSGLRLDYGAFPSDGYLVFVGTGAAGGNGTFTFCDGRGPAGAEAVIVSRTGRVRHSRSKPDGAPLDC